MYDLLQRVEENGCSKLGTVLHLGAGTCGELQDYLRLDADKVVLVEANPELAGRLDSRYRELRHVKTINAAVAAHSGAATLWILNNPKESSIQRPTGILETYPNLRVADERSISTVTLAELVGEIVLDGTRPHLLLMEVQGTEVSILTSTSAALLQKFSWVAVRASQRAMYSDGGTTARVDQALRQHGFKPVVGPRETFESPFEELLYLRDDHHIQLVALRDQLSEKMRQIESLQTQLNHDQITRIGQTAGYASLKQESTGYRKRIGELQAELDRQKQASQEHAQLAESRRVSIEQLAKDQTQFVDRIKTLEGERHVHAQKISELEAELERLTQEQRAQLTSQEDERSAATQRLAEFELGVRQQTELAQARQREIERLVLEREGQLARIGELEAEAHRLAQANDEQVLTAEGRRAEIERLTGDLAAHMARIKTLEGQWNDHKQQINELEAELERLTQEQRAQVAGLEEERKIAAQRLIELDAQVLEKGELAQVRQTEIEQLVLERESHLARIGELEAEAHRLAQANDEQVLSAEGRRVEIEQLTKDQAAHVARIKTLEGQWNEHKQQIDELEAELERLAQTRLAQEASAEEERVLLAKRVAEIEIDARECAELAEVRQSEIERLAQIRDGQLARITEIAAEVGRLTNTIQQQTQLAEDRRADVERLTKDQATHVARIKTLEGEWHEHTGTINERNSEIARLTQALQAQTASAEGRLQEIRQLTQERAGLEVQIKKLESEKSELDYRQKLFDAEMFKAEAQLELIKDVLLREKEF